MILLNPGPVNVSERVRRALRAEDICHREEEFSSLQRGVREGLLRAFAPGENLNKEYTVVVITGSGTAAVEAALASCLDREEKLLVLNNGVYGERMVQIAAAHGINHAELRFNYHERPDLEAVERALAGDPAVRTVAMVHHETTTGLLNPVGEVGRLVRRGGRRLLLDSVSGLGGEPLDLSQDAVDICVGTAGKCVQGFPGVSFVLVRREEMQRWLKHPPRSLYLHLPAHFVEQERGSVPFTPAVQLYAALDEALRELLEEGVAQRISRYGAAARLIRKGCEALGLELYLPEALRSHSITAVCLPEGVRYEALHDGLRRGGYVIYAGQGALRSRLFRVANMGALTQQDFEGFLRRLETVLQSLKKG